MIPPWAMNIPVIVSAIPYVCKWYCDHLQNTFQDALWIIIIITLFDWLHIRHNGYVTLLYRKWYRTIHGRHRKRIILILLLIITAPQNHHHHHNDDGGYSNTIQYRHPQHHVVNRVLNFYHWRLRSKVPVISSMRRTMVVVMVMVVMMEECGGTLPTTAIPPIVTTTTTTTMTPTRLWINQVSL